MQIHISDLDGTLLGSNQLLSAKTVGVLNGLIDAGRLHFTIATARSFESCWPIIKELKLKLPFILHNGAFVFDPGSRKYIKENILSVQQTMEIITRLTHAELHPLVFSHSLRNGKKVYYTGVYNEGERMYVEKRLAAKDPRFTLVGDASAIPEADAIEVMAIDTWDKIEPAYENFRKCHQWCCHLTQDIYSGFYNLEISEARANKKEGVQYLRAYTGATKITAFGDNLNDVPMFEASDESHAVANAHPALKAMCDGIIGSNDEDGVACFLQDRFR